MKKIILVFLFFILFSLLSVIIAEDNVLIRPLEFDGSREEYIPDCEPPKYDYGDAPASYSTLNGNNPAKHFNAGPFMGNYWDLEWNGAPSTNAEGDNNHNGLSGWPFMVDDEDGVTFNTPWLAGTQAQLQVAINDFSYGNGCNDDWYLNVWADFSGNGNWGDAGEHIIDDLLVTPGNHNLTVNIPANSVQFVYLRFRLSSYQNVNYFGTVCDGEVEDYKVEVAQPQPGSIGDYVWNDINQNGIQDEIASGIPEPPISGVTVNLLRGVNYIPAGSMITGADGFYLFPNLEPDIYFVEFVPPAGEGWEFTFRDMGSDDALDSDATPINNHTSGITDQISLASGENNLTIDAGLFGGDPFLPVTLSSFTAAYQSSNAALLWTTQSESQNSHWNIFRGLSSESNSSIQLNASGIMGAGTTSLPTNYSYTDTGLESIIPIHNLDGVNVWYWLESVDNSGATELFGPVMIFVESEDFDIDAPSLEKKHGLGSNYPNPFNPDTEISYTLKEAGRGSLSVYNIKGGKVKELFSGRYFDADKLYFEAWNGEDDNGFIVASGCYMFVLKTDKEFYVRKVILQK